MTAGELKVKSNFTDANAQSQVKLSNRHWEERWLIQSYFCELSHIFPGAKMTEDDGKFTILLYNRISDANIMH